MAMPSEMRLRQLAFLFSCTSVMLLENLTEAQIKHPFFVQAIRLQRLRPVQANGPDRSVVADSQSHTVTISIRGGLVDLARKIKVASLDIVDVRPDVARVEKDRAREILA